MSKVEDVPVYETDNTGMVKIDVLATTDNFNPHGFFDGPVDAAEAKRAVSKLKAVEEMLKAQEEFGRQAVKFCLLEAQVFIKIAESDGAEEQLTEAKQRLVRWIRSKDEAELAQILGEVSTGVRISAIERRENKQPTERYDAATDCKRIQKAAIDELTRTGITTINRATFYEHSENPARLDKKTIAAFYNSSTNEALRKGAYGLGDGSGTYIMPRKLDRQTTAQVVKTRIESIVRDIKSLKQICDEAKFIIPQNGVDIIIGLVKSLNDNTGVIDIDVER